MASGADGGSLIDPIKVGQETVVAVAAQLLSLDRVPPAEQRAARLRQMPDAELASARLGVPGVPGAEVITEVLHRMQGLLKRFGPVVDSLRNAGILPAS
ncbi:hypothetical protein [Streptomyces sp. NPDC003393]